MANVGTAAAGQVLQGSGNGASPTFKSIGVNSGLTVNGVLIAEGNNAFTATAAGSAGQVLTSNGAGNDPTFQAASASGAITTITGNSGGAQSPSAGNFNVVGSGSITSVGTANTETIQLTGLTNHAVLVGAGTDTITKVGPSSTTGQVLQNNAAADPSYSTATYPSVATGTGTILRSDGTNWVATTSTYPNTNAVNTLLYASSANVMAALATANSGVLTTSTSGVPSIDTTNFQVLATGVQMKGNNTNTAPPAGFIGERIENTATAVAMTSNVAKTITSISLTAGVWDVSAIAYTQPTGGSSLGGNFIVNISPTDNTLVGTLGIEQFNSAPVGGFLGISGVVPALRVNLSSTTTYYLVCSTVFPAISSPTNGRISATRVG